ncbi:MAG: YqgE/AlgH family protein [Paracoccaceae bacterium]
MNTLTESIDLNGKLLIAMPGMSDPRFVSSVVFMCAYSDEGAMGLIVNKPADELQINDLLTQLEIPKGNGSRDIRVHFGGPVEVGRGFVLHSADYDGGDATMDVDDQFGMTATKDVLEALANGTGPDVAMLMLGYAGWEPGQLENEIKANGWLVADASHEIVFGADSSTMWVAALKTLGVDPMMLSATAGRA